MGFGDAFKKKLHDVTKAVEKVADVAEQAIAKQTQAPVQAKPPSSEKVALQPEREDEEMLEAEAAGSADDEQDDDKNDEEEKSYPVPSGWDLSDVSNEQFWIHAFEIDDAQAKGDGALEQVLRRNQIESYEHYLWLRNRFAEHHGADPDFQQAMVNGRIAATRAQMQSALKPGTLDPVEGISMETYATIQARRTKLPGTVEAFGKLLAEYGMDEVKWTRVDKVWMARMSDAGDQMATAAVNTEYAKYFAAAGVGQFGAAAKAASANLGVGDAVGSASSADPCTFERYVEIMTAQSCWATQGRDVNAMLKKVFNMSAMDYSNLSAHWAPKMMSDMKLMTEVMPALQAKYGARYSEADPDGDLAV